MAKDTLRQRVVKRVGWMTLGAALAVGYVLYFTRPLCYIYHVKATASASYKTLNFMEVPLSKILQANKEVV